MAEFVDIKITNLPQLRAAFGRAPSLMTRELNNAIRKTVLAIQGKEVLQYRSLGIGIRTGGLISSVERGTYFGDLKGEVGPNVTGSQGVKYAVYVHNGTRYMPSKPFLTNAVNQVQFQTDQFFTEAVQNVLNDIGRSV
jgi:HK97 gp10 family phage protein